MNQNTIMNVYVAKLGTVVKDRPSGITGTLTSLYFGYRNYSEARGDSSITDETYLLRPNGLNKDTGLPLAGFWTSKARMECEFENVSLPLEIIGTAVKHKTNGFKGTAIGLVRYQNGCIHIEVLPPGVQKNGEGKTVEQFDWRELTGPAIVSMSETAVKKSLVTHPSPGPFVARNPRGV